VRLAFGVCRCTFAQGRSGTLSCFARFVNPLDFLFRGVGGDSNQLLRNPFCTRYPLRRGRILLPRFLPSTPSNFLFFEVLATCRTSSFAARLSTGAHCEGGASYCLVCCRQAPRIFYLSRSRRPVESVPSQPVFQPAPAAKGAHLTVWLQGVNTPREIFFECVSTAKNMVISSPRENPISWPSREFARASLRLEEFFLMGKVPLKYSQRHSNLLLRDR
jgi:hypothetical protein